jgi:hypothetical protein
MSACAGSYNMTSSANTIATPLSCRCRVMHLHMARNTPVKIYLKVHQSMRSLHSIVNYAYHRLFTYPMTYTQQGYSVMTLPVNKTSSSNTLPNGLATTALINAHLTNCCEFFCKDIFPAGTIVVVIGLQCTT